MKLCIVIPALNEEESIESIILRTLDAKESIIENTPVTDVGITVVSDGSTDNTAAIASRFTDKISLVVFEKNRGYGAAIKEGWRQTNAELLGFLDADGTCDPKFFIQLCQLITEESADVVLGSRLNENSKMPMIRKIGNTIFSLLLSYLGSQKVNDTASGMRVVRRDSLQELMPLPDGLHFTPAMSARSILNNDIKIMEIDMPYQEREGESKLNPLKDGIRFLNVILKTAALYKPNRILTLLGLFQLVFAGLLMISPILHYLKFTEVEEWMIYRFLVSNLFGISAVLFLAASYIAECMVGITISNKDFDQMKLSAIGRAFRSPWIWVVPLLGMILGLALVWESVFGRLMTGETSEHWSRYVAMSFFVSMAIIVFVTKCIEKILEMLSMRMQYLSESKSK